MTDNSEPSSALEDPRIQFFLKNQDQIREWAALATELFDAVELTLRELRLDLANDDRVRSLDIRVGERVNGETATGPVLYREGWCLASPGIPDVGVAIGWDGRVDPAGMWPRSAFPYLGVSTAHGTEAGLGIESRLRAAINATFVESSGQAGPSFKKGSHWIVFRFVKSDPTWWQDIPAWRTWMSGQLIETWERWAPEIDSAISQLGGSAGNASRHAG
jgi:hypothetical protein